MDFLEKIRNFTTNRVQGYVAISDTVPPPLDPTTESDTSRFKTPQIIAFSDADKGRPLSTLAYNKAGDKYKNYDIQFGHAYEENCQLLLFTAPLFAIMAVIMAIVGFVWGLFIYKIFTARQHGIQKWLIMVPVAKAAYYG